MAPDSGAEAAGEVASAESSLASLSVYELLLALRARGVELRLDGDALRAASRGERLSDALRALLRERSASIAAFLRQAALARDVGPARALRSAVGAPGSDALAQPSAARDAGPEPRARAPLTRAQRRLWLIERLQPGTTAYSLPYAFRVSGRVDPDALAAALSELVARHEALRTRIGEDESGPFLHVDDASSWSADIVPAPAELEPVLAREAARPFDLAKGPLFRATVYVLSERELVLFFNVQHIVCDGWSIEIMLRELQILQRARSTEGAPLLPAPAIQYADYARIEGELSSGPEASAALERACGRLRDLSPLELPTDRPRPAVFHYRGGVQRFRLEPQLVAALKQLAHERGVTSYMLLLAAYQVLLHRYSGQRDIVVGSPIAGRERVETEDVVGFFANTLVLRAELRRELSFLQLLERTREICLAAFDDRLVPFERLVEALNPPRDRSRTPIFQAIFTLQETAQRDVDPALSWERLALGSAGTKTDLTLLLEDDGSEIAGWLEYSSELFEPESMLRFARNYETLLRSIAAEPEAALGALAIVSDEERSALMRLNQTARALPKVQGFQQLIEAQAAHTPDRTAVEDEEGQLSYRELDARATYWASRFLARGVARGARVGIAVERTRHLVELVLGVLKAGAAYVPLDTSYPPERLGYMIEDAGLSLIVSGEAQRERLPEGRCELLIADPDGRERCMPRPTDERRVRQVQRDLNDIAYVIYTSGSTGKPKGVQVPHRAVVNFLSSMARVPGCAPHDRVIALTTLSFDIAVLELFLPLTIGARTIVARRGAGADGTALARLIDKHAATVVQATPATWRLLVAAGFSRRIRKAISGGEPFPVQLARDLVPRCDEVWNGYGPTETTVYSSFYRVSDPERPILIGTPVDNTQLYVLDERLAPVPFGVAGELYIGGLGVSAGYLGKPELTEARFLADPFADGAGARLYRTGDLSRMRAQGVQFLGRADDQVKLRGYRIELGEIEAVLAQDPAVAQCAVAVRDFAADDRRLVAYVVTVQNGQSSSPIERLRARASAQLPDYMVPRHFVELPALPLTPNGKVDRKKLPAPSGLGGERPRAEAPPADAIERLLLEIWTRVLGVPSVGVNDNFFELGGHSLLALKLLQEVNRACNTKLPLSLVFEAPTIEEQARAIDEGEYGTGVSVVPLQPAGTKPPLFCVCGINLYQNLAKHLGAARPVYGLFLPIEAELLEGRAVELSVREMSRQYVQAIRARMPRGPYHLVGISFGGVLAYEVAQQLRAQGEHVGVLGLLDVLLDHALKRRGLGALASFLAPRLPAGLRGWFELGLEQLGRLRAELRAARVAEPFAMPVDGRHADLDRLRLESYRRAWAHYSPTMLPYDGPALVVRARDEIETLSGYAVAYDHGWSRYVRQQLHCHDVPGTHLGILDEPYVAEVASLLDTFLTESDARGRPEAAATEWPA